jgi:PIN domain nuclease of toxin-antitoxin system
MTILDASAVLALLQDEPGADVVEDAIEDGATISAVNLTEVLAKMVDAGTAADAAADLIVSLFVEVAPFGLESARDAARIRAAARPAGLSLGDRACLSLARLRATPVITADRAWLGSSASVGVEVRSIR